MYFHAAMAKSLRVITLAILYQHYDAAEGTNRAQNKHITEYTAVVSMIFDDVAEKTTTHYTDHNW
jgi:hypothetical protein